MQGPDAPRCIHPGMCGLVELWKTLYRSSYLRHLMMTPEWRDGALFRYAPPLSIMANWMGSTWRDLTPVLELGQLQYIIEEFARLGHTLMHATDYVHYELTLLPPRVQRTMNDTPGAEDGREITLHTQPGPLLNDHRCRRRVARVVTEYLVRQALKLDINVRDAPERFGASNALVDYLAIPVYYEGHYSLVIATNLRTMVSGKLSETVEGSVELVHYDSAQLHTKMPEVMEGVKNLVCQSLYVCALMFRVCWQPEDIPQQSNVVDCGIYVGMYLHALVSSGFSILKEWMPFYDVKSWAYRRQLREEVSLHATGDLIVKLFGEGVDVPVQPLPKLGEYGALVFPKEDEVRTDLARQSGMITRMELGGYVVCAAVMGLARSLGISEDQLLSGAAHELQAHDMPLLALSTSKNHVEHAASMRTLDMTIHSTPCPLPLPSFPSAHLDGSSIIHSTGQQIRLGAYNVELDAAYAYAVAAFMIRRNDHIQHTKELSDTEKASLIECVRDDVRHLVKAQMWWRWRQWRTTMEELGIAPSTPFPLKNNGARSSDNSSGDDDVGGRMVHDVEAVDE
ncbi:unnamed protein product [Closterium sp. NIES-65]|nr:unnamed protein product [Closterium sp. NIES-65]